MVIKHNNEEKVAFFLSVSEGLSLLDFYILDFIISLDLLSKAISELVSNCQATYVKRITVTT